MNVVKQNLSFNKYKWLTLLLFITTCSIAIIITLIYLVTFSNHTVKVLNIESREVKNIIKAYPDDFKDINVSLSPHIFYKVNYKGKSYIIYTAEGSGVENIFEAKCYSYKLNSIKYLGQYIQKAYDSYALYKIKNLDPRTCVPFEMEKI